VQEGFYVILLDRKNHPLGRVLVTLGTLTSSLVHPREVFRPAGKIAAPPPLCDCPSLSSSARFRARCSSRCSQVR